MRRLADLAVGAVLLLPILAVGLLVLVRDLWRMRRVRWTKSRRP